MSRRAFALALCALLARAEAAEIPAAVDPALIVNYRVARPGLATAGRLSEEGLAQLRGLGFRTVVNLRTASEGAARDEAALTGQGLRYFGRPVTADGLTLADVEAIGALIDEPGAAPALLYCASGNRVGGVWAVLQVLKGKPKVEALGEGQAIGLRPGPMTLTTERLIDEVLARRASAIRR